MVSRASLGLATKSDHPEILTTRIGTLAKAAAVLKENGAKSVLALVTHGILSGNAIEILNGSVLEALVVTNTVPLGDKVERVGGCDFVCSTELIVGSVPSSA